MRRVTIFLAVVVTAAASWSVPARAHIGSHEVTIRNLAFDPEQLLGVDVGETVTWLNSDDLSHDVSFGSGLMSRGDTYSHTFAEAGWFTYFCEIHPEMKGAISVGGAVEPEIVLDPRDTIYVPADMSLSDAVSVAAPGTDIIVSSGTHRITKPLSISQDDVTLRGESAADDVVIRAAGAVNYGVVVSGNGVTVENLTLESFRDAGLRVAGAGGFSIERVITAGFSNGGFALVGIGGGGLRDVEVRSPKVAGIVVEDCGSCGVRIDDSKIAGGRDAVVIRRASGVVIDDLVAGGAARSGALVAGSSGVTITNSELSSAGYGLAVTADGANPARDVTVSSNSLAGAWASRGWDGLGVRVSFTDNEESSAETGPIVALRLAVA